MDTKSATYDARHIARVRLDVQERTSKHVITTRKLDGMYRHWRCAQPGTGADHFNIVTWPGFLCYCGDMGEYLFSRTDDMVSFMRGSAMSFEYAAEKCIAHGEPIREFRYEVFEQLLDDEEKLLDDEYEPEDVESRREKIESLRAVVNEESHEHEVYTAISDSGLWDGCDFPDCSAFEYRFLWCLFAIKWFCDNVKDA